MSLITPANLSHTLRTAARAQQRGQGRAAGAAASVAALRAKCGSDCRSGSRDPPMRRTVWGMGSPMRRRGPCRSSNTRSARSMRSRAAGVQGPFDLLGVHAGSIEAIEIAHQLAASGAAADRGRHAAVHGGGTATPNGEIQRAAAEAGNRRRTCARRLARLFRLSPAAVRPWRCASALRRARARRQSRRRTSRREQLSDREKAQELEGADDRVRAARRHHRANAAGKAPVESRTPRMSICRISVSIYSMSSAGAHGGSHQPPSAAA